MFSWTVSKYMLRGITTSTDSVRAELIMMSPVMTETTLILKTSGGRMSQSRIGDSWDKCKRDSSYDSD